MMDPETIKQSLLSLAILLGIFGFVWWKWKDDLIFNYRLIMAKISPSEKGDRALMEQAFAPPQTFKSAFGNLFQSKGSVPELDASDYYNDRKFWRNEDDE